ncbi:pseudouridine synthase [Miniphocaeibacter massiliensis]|uniref:pseudouridine synthase n=1 Tax=Miniphocaeibacter massiliensis TaxID=2041841 RepID=UPI000C078417|nr:pseudouridine synthase [Miniphocaeibacter massiliensis]
MAKKQSLNNKEKNIIEHKKKDSIRLNKYISDCGYCSRREADRLIEAGKVLVDGVEASVGMKINKNQIVEVEGNILKDNKERIYIALNKPKGITSTTDVNIKGNLTTLMNYPEMIFQIGRLDKDSTGLLLMTNDGDIVNKILREENGHDKEYLVTVNNRINEKFLKSMEQGVKIYNPVSNKYQKTKPAKVVKVSNKSFKIILQQGLNRQIRRMTKELGYRVVALKRLRVMNIKLGDLKEGGWRYLTEEELIEMNSLINKNIFYEK